jgi:hypothetical protein
MFVDLARLSVLAEQTTENPLATHPEDLGGHAGLRGTLALTGTGVAALALGCVKLAGACAGVDDGRLDDNSAVLDELFNVCARVGIPNF